MIAVVDVQKILGAPLSIYISTLHSLVVDGHH